MDRIVYQFINADQKKGASQEMRLSENQAYLKRVSFHPGS